MHSIQSTTSSFLGLAAFLICIGKFQHMNIAYNQGDLTIWLPEKLS